MPILTEITTRTEASKLRKTLDILKRIHDELYPSHLSQEPLVDQLDRTVSKQTVLKALFGDELVPEDLGSGRLRKLLLKYHTDKLAEDHPLYKELYECSQILTRIKDVYNELSTGPAVDLSSQPATAAASSTDRRRREPESQAEFEKLIQKVAKRQDTNADQDFIDLIGEASKREINNVIAKLEELVFAGRSIPLRFTPLSSAVCFRSSAALKVLLEKASPYEINKAMQVSSGRLGSFETPLHLAARHQDAEGFEAMLKAANKESIDFALSSSRAPGLLQLMAKDSAMSRKLPILCERIYSTDADIDHGEVPDEFINFVADCFMDKEKWIPARDSFNEKLLSGILRPYTVPGSLTTLERVLKTVSDKVASTATADVANISSEVYFFMSDGSLELAIAKLHTVTVDNPVLDLRGTGILRNIAKQYSGEAEMQNDHTIHAIFNNPTLRVVKIETDLEPDVLKRMLAAPANTTKIERLEINGKVYLPSIEKRLEAYIDRVKASQTFEGQPDFRAKFKIFTARQGRGREVNYELAKQLLEDLKNPRQNAEDVFKSSHVDTERQTIRDKEVTGPKSPFSSLRVTSSELRGIISDARSQLKPAAAEAKTAQAGADATSGNGYTPGKPGP